MDGGLPSLLRCLHGPKVILILPSLALVLAEAVQAIETHYVSEPVSIGNNSLQTRLLLVAPLAVMLFASLLDIGPIKTPPAMVVVPPFRCDLFHGHRDETIYKILLRQV